MANKKITDLQLKSSVVGDESCPVDNGIQSYRTTPAQWYDYMRSRLNFGQEMIENLTIVTSVGSSALTIALKTKAAADASSTDPIRVGFRSATLTSGAYVSRTITGALSLVISSGSTLGQVSGQASRIWVYLIDNSGTPELAVSKRWYPDDEIVSTTAEGGAGAADSASTIYSTSARSNVAIRVIGYIDNTQTTAGTWASAGSKIQLANAPVPKPMTVTTLTSGSGTYYPPAGCRAIKVRLVGGGGGGGAAANVNTSSGSGGSGGGYCEKFYTGADLVGSYSYSVGAYGGGGTASGSGSNGGDTTFGGMTGAAGGGGIGSSGTTAASYRTDSRVGGLATGGDINIQGEYGDAGLVLASSQGSAGHGGSSPLGCGGKRVINAGTGNAATGYGAGGSGACSNGGGATNGGDGAPGVIIIEEIY